DARGGPEGGRGSELAPLELGLPDPELQQEQLREEEERAPEGQGTAGGERAFPRRAPEGSAGRRLDGGRADCAALRETPGEAAGSGHQASARELAHAGTARAPPARALRCVALLLEEEEMVEPAEEEVLLRGRSVVRRLLELAVAAHDRDVVDRTEPLRQQPVE